MMFTEAPQRTGQCLRSNGIFPHEDPTRCDEYYQCNMGVETLTKCPDSLLFNPATGVCDFPDRIDTSNCHLSRKFI